MEQTLTPDARPMPDHVVVRFDHAGMLTEEDGREMIRRIRCARAASGQAAIASPSSVMNSRRFIALTANPRTMQSIAGQGRATQQKRAT
jgi:hypothetical protein